MHKYDTIEADLAVKYPTQESREAICLTFLNFTNRQLAKSWKIDIAVIQRIRKWLFQ
jgi:hypothetical protein